MSPTDTHAPSPDLSDPRALGATAAESVASVTASPRSFFLLGATGRTGLPFLEQALARGHAVTVFVRSPTKLPAAVASHPRLRTFTGALDEAAKVTQAMRETKPDVVYAMLASDPAPHTAVSTGTHSALLALRELGLGAPVPFISIAGWGLGPTMDHVKGAFGRLVVAAGKSFLWAKPFADFEKQLTEVETARVEGLIRPIIVMPPILTGGARTSDYLAGEAQAMKDAMRVTKTISRASMADLCLKLGERAASGEALPQWVAVTNP